MNIKKGFDVMKKLMSLIICITITVLSFQAVVFAETNTVDYGGSTFTYDDNGNVTISFYAINKDVYDWFLSYVGNEYVVKTICLEGKNDGIEIDYEAFSGSSDTLEVINLPMELSCIRENAFGETCNAQIRYVGNAELWNNIYKENDTAYYGDIEYYANGYAGLSWVTTDAYNDKISGEIHFDFVDRDCVAELNVYNYNENNETVLDTTFTLDIPANTDTIDYEYDYVSDGNGHLISVTIYNNLTNREQWGDIYESNFIAYNNPLVCDYIDVLADTSILKLLMDFKFVNENSIAYLEIFDYGENDSLIPNKNLAVEIPAGTTHFEDEIPFAFDNKSHLLKVSFYDNMIAKNELYAAMTCDFSAMREYNGFLYDFIDEETVKITSCSNYSAEAVIPTKISNCTVTEISENAFGEYTGFVTITIPDTITAIGNGAFSGCSDLATVNYIGTESDWSAITIGENNSPLETATIIYEYAPPIYAQFNGGYDGKNLNVSVWIDNCYKDYLAKIELVNISKNETTTLYYDIKAGAYGEQNYSIPLVSSDETYRIYGSVVSTDKKITYLAPFEFMFFTPIYENIYDKIIVENDFEYYVNENNEAEIVAYKGSETAIIIPDTLGGFNVTSLMGWSLSGLEITDLTIGKNLKNIGYGALSYCYNLENITVSSENSYFKFEDGVLYNADKTKLVLYLLSNTQTHFDMPDSVTVVGAHAFEGTENLNTLTISDNVTDIERQAFAYSTISGELILPEGLQTIGSEALTCNFSKIHIPSSVTLIAKDAIGGSIGLKEITVDDENNYYTAIDGVLYNKDESILIKYPEEKAAQLFIIPDTVTEMNSCAFMGTTNLIKVVIPQSVKLINYAAFNNSSVRAVFYSGSSDEYKKVAIGDYNPILIDTIIGESKIVSDENFQYEITPENTILKGCNSLLSGYVSIPETIDEIPVDTIGANAFRGQYNITTLFISKNIKTFDVYHAFEGLELERYEVDENNKIFSIDDSGILYNKSKTQLIKYPIKNQAYSEQFIIPQSVETILPFCFSRSSISEIIINENVKSINRYAFVNMYDLQNFVVNDNDTYIAIDGVLYTADNKTLIQYPIGRETEAFVVPDTVINIAQDAFRSAWGIKEITLPLGLKNIGSYAFYDCENLSYITIPAGVTQINSFTFYECLSLNKVTFSENVKNIKTNAFGLCPNLGEICYTGTQEQYENIDIHESNTALSYDKISYVIPGIEICSQTANKISFKVRYILNPARILIARYKNGVFAELEEMAYSPDKIESTTIDSAFDYEKDTIKIMVWNDISTLKPLCEPLKIGK